MKTQSQKSAVMAMAWKLFKEVYKPAGESFSNALKKAWYMIKKQSFKATSIFEDALKNAKKSGMSKFFFVVDGGDGYSSWHVVGLGVTNRDFSSVRSANEYLLKFQGFLA